MSDIGRWGSLDREAERTYHWTPYRYGYNNPARFFDTDGMTEEERQKAVEWARQYIKDNQSLKYIQNGVNDCSGYINLVLTAVGFPNLKTGDGEFRGATNGVSQLARNTRQVDILEAREGDILTMWSKRNDHKGVDGEFDHTGIVMKVYTDENGNVTGYRIGNFQSSGLREFDYFFDNGDVKKGKGINWVSLRGAYQWDTPDNPKNAKMEKNGKSKDGNITRETRGRLKNTLDVLTNSDLFEVWMHQQVMDADKRQSQSNN